MFDDFDASVTCEECYNDNWYDEQYEIDDQYDSALDSDLDPEEF